MTYERSLMIEKRHAATVTRESAPAPDATVLFTRDHEIIKAWAKKVDAEPATGEATTSGPATAQKVEDLGSGLRFNFPGMSRFRPISWTEWFDHFNGHDLTFVFEPAAGEAQSARYRIVATSELTDA
jgi:hypothetical protein